MNFLRVLLVLFLVLLIPAAFAQETLESGGSEKLTVYFFYSTTCPHCADEREFLKTLEGAYPDVEFVYLEASKNTELFQQLAAEHGISAQWVPVTFIGSCYVIGFDNAENMGREIEDKIKNEQGECDDDEKIIVPIIGEIDPKEISLPLFTLVIAGLDGFNPCAMWVLCFLLTLLIYAQSRKKILLIGGIFVFASAFVYFLFMTAWLNLFLIIGYVAIFRILIAIMAIVMGGINVKDFFFFKKGVSLTIPEKAKPGLFKKMRELTQTGTLPAIIAGAVVLAFTANFIELLCTAGFPAIYTRILTLQELPLFTYYLYLVLYNVIYVIPLAAIVLIFALTMGKRKFTEKQGRILKLIGGMLMLALGLILLLAPELLMFG